VHSIIVPAFSKTEIVAYWGKKSGNKSFLLNWQTQYLYNLENMGHYDHNILEACVTNILLTFFQGFD
jgi:hypothetical protein